MTRATFDVWVTDELHLEERVLEETKLVPAFDLLVCRVEEAERNGAVDPLKAIRPRTAGGNSRLATIRTLDQLRCSGTHRRVLHRLLGGSTSGWLGLVELYAQNADLTDAQRRYARRQIRLILASLPVRDVRPAPRSPWREAGARPVPDAG